MNSRARRSENFKVNGHSFSPSSRRSSGASPAALRAACWLLALCVIAGCDGEVRETAAPLGGTCLSCHAGISSVHPWFALACVDCHGGNDAVGVPADQDARDPAALARSHVVPVNPADAWPNGIDDDGDGEVDELGEYFDGRVVDEAGVPGLSEGRLAAKGQLDAEMNRDMNYLRFVNPSDLRVAQVSCGGRNKNANAAMACHAEIVYDVRRSIMSAHDAVPTGAVYGNAQLPRALDYGAAFAASAAGQRFDARDPRIGRVGYTLDYDALDAAYDPAANAFSRAALLEVAAANDDPSDDLFEATAAPLRDDGSDPLDPGPGLTRTGHALKFFSRTDPSSNRAIAELMPLASRANRAWPRPGSLLELRLQRVLASFGLPAQSPLTNDFDNDAATPGTPLTNPVDGALRAFRAYHSLNWWGPSDNFGAVDFFPLATPADPAPVAPDPLAVDLRNKNNPFGRGRPSGCAACHIAYAKDGKNREERDRTVADNGHQPDTDLPFGVRADLGQHAYAEKHVLNRAVKSEQCASCHGFVTRVDYALNGMYEHEADLSNPEATATLGPLEFLTPPTPRAASGTCVKIFDNLAHYQDGVLENAGEGVSEDANNNGELDPGEDQNGDGCLNLPDRVARSGSFDGRQQRIVYGGANGAMRLMDVHTERGMGCTDCHYVWDVHGDGNVYSRNWDAVAVECEDCHGTPEADATLVTSGPNGGDDMTNPRFATAFGTPWFERRGDRVVEHSRETAGRSWDVPQLRRPKDNASAYAHMQALETQPDDEQARRPYAHIARAGQPGGLECYACHSSWQPNCLSCHIKVDVTKPKQEIWLSNSDVEDVFFQLFSFTRSPFLLGRAGDVEGNKISPYRSTMQVHVNVVAGNATLADNVMFTTQGGLSSLASNPYFPHTVRTAETKSCARCHTLLDATGNVANDHLLNEAVGAGTGRYNNVGDWALVATDTGMLQLDLKREGAGDVVFPGFDFSDAAPRVVTSAVGLVLDVALVRGVTAVNGDGDTADLALVAHGQGLSVVDVTGRDHSGLPPTELARVDALGAVVSVDHVDPGASQVHTCVVVTESELAVVAFGGSLGADTAGASLRADAGPFSLDAAAPPDAAARSTVVGALAHGKSAVTRVRLHGRYALVTHAAGLSVFELAPGTQGSDAELGAPLSELVTFPTGAPALDVAAVGRFAYVATGAGGVAVFDVGPAVFALDEDIVQAPVALALQAPEVADSRGVAVWGSRIVVADGANGLRIIDVSTPAAPRLEQTIRDVASGPPIDEAAAVVMAAVPVRSFALVADGSHGVRAVNLTSVRDVRQDLAAAAQDPDAFRGLRLSMERQDPLTPRDPKNAELQVFTYPTAGAARRVARGLSLDALADPSGRRLRDSWSIGAGSIDVDTIARMRRVRVREVAGTADRRGDGLGCVVRDGDEEGVARDPNDASRCLPTP